MSRAFVKEDVEVVERSARRRSASGLPPGASNYLTASGAARLQAQLDELRAAGGADDSEIANLQETLASAEIVPPKVHPESVIFGACVTLQLADGSTESYRIAGVDELALDAQNVSWVSPIGRALLGAEPGQRVLFPGEEKAVRRVAKIE